MKLVSRKFILPAVVSFGLFLVFSLWIMYGFIEMYRIHKNSQKIVLNSLADIVEATLRSELDSKNDFNRKKIEKLFAFLVHISPIEAIGVKTGKEEIVILTNRENSSSFNVFNIPHGSKLMRVKRVINTAYGGRKTVFSVVFKMSALTGQYNVALNLLSSLFVSVCIIVLFFYFLWTSLLKMRDLNSRLLSERNRSVYVDELSLAAAGLAHETKNPLGIIRGLAQSITDSDINNEEIRKIAMDIMEETDITTARLGDFLSYAKFRSPDLDKLDALEYIERLAGLLKDDMKNARVELVLQIPSICIYADKDMLSQILVNLMTNSLRYCEVGGKITVKLSKKPGHLAELSVADNGTGISDDVLPNIFKPYFTNSASGYGIGLAIVKRIVEQSGWSIKVQSKVGKGTKVIISGIKICRLS